MKNNPNKSRLSMLINIAWYEDVRRPFMGLLISMGIMLSVFIFFVFNSYNSSYRPSDSLIEVEAAFFSVAMYVLAAYSGTLVGNCFSSKPKAISALMLPASQSEKFWLRLVIFVPLFFIAFAACACVVDIVRYFVALIVTRGECTVHLGITHYSFDCDFWMMVCLCVAAQSFFVLGGTVWPKRGLIFTALTYFIYGWAFTLFIIGVAYTMRDYSMPLISNYLHEITRIKATAIIDTLALVTSAVNYALAYLRTKEIEIIQRW